MRIVKTDTYLKPFPTENIAISGSSFTFTPILGTIGIPTSRKFVIRPRSYVFGVFSGEDSWISLKFDKTGTPFSFSLPEELAQRPRPYSVFMGYNDGLLGGSYLPGYYSLKQKIQYWYCIAKTHSIYPIRSYVIAGNEAPKSHYLFDLSSRLNAPNSTIWQYYKIGDPIVIGQMGIHLGDIYDE